MSAIAALLNPPKVTHVASRLVVSGKTVYSRKDLPPLPDAEIREAAHKMLIRMKKRQWEKANIEKKRESAKRSYHKNKDSPEYQKKRKAAQKKYEERHPEKVRQSQRKWYRKNKELVMQKQREYRERKRQCLMQAMTDTAKQS